MGLDAYVYCDCIEKGRLHTSHPVSERLYINEAGEPEIRVDDLPNRFGALEVTHWNWVMDSPCEHHQCVLLHHYLGNISLVASLRDSVTRLSGEDTNFPILRRKVIHNGIHSGDWLPREEVESLALELRELEGLDWSHLDKEDAGFLRVFLEQVEELIAASRSVNKPIVF